jgi:hypothetical protein
MSNIKIGPKLGKFEFGSRKIEVQHALTKNSTSKRGCPTVVRKSSRKSSNNWYYVPKNAKSLELKKRIKQVCIPTAAKQKIKVANKLKLKKDEDVKIANASKLKANQNIQRANKAKVKANQKIAIAKAAKEASNKKHKLKVAYDAKKKALEEANIAKESVAKAKKAEKEAAKAKIDVQNAKEKAALLAKADRKLKKKQEKEAAEARIIAANAKADRKLKKKKEKEAAAARIIAARAKTDAHEAKLKKKQQKEADVARIIAAKAKIDVQNAKEKAELLAKADRKLKKKQEKEAAAARIIAAKAKADRKLKKKKEKEAAAARIIAARAKTDAHEAKLKKKQQKEADAARIIAAKAKIDVQNAKEKAALLAKADRKLKKKQEKEADAARIIAARAKTDAYEAKLNKKQQKEADAARIIAAKAKIDAHKAELKKKQAVVAREIATQANIAAQRAKLKKDQGYEAADERKRKKTQEKASLKAALEENQNKTPKMMARYWKEKGTHSSFLNNELLIYRPQTFSRVGGPLGNATAFVKSVWKDKEKLNALRNSATLIVPKELPSIVVENHLAFRHPVHIGVHYPLKPGGLNQTYRSIQQNVMQDVLGYSSKDTLDVEHTPFIRYGILAETPVDPEGGTADSAWFLHTWGVNLESTYTTDALYVFEGGRFDITKYKKLLNIYFRIVDGAVKELHYKTNKPVLLRITALGLGEWGREIPYNQESIIKDYYLKNLTEIAARYESWLQVRHPDYPKNRTIFVAPTGKFFQAESNHDPFGKPDTVFEYDYRPYPKDSVILIVNAWDDRSFIGNSVALDDSLDGWTVAGGTKDLEGDSTLYDFKPGIGHRPLGGYFVNAAYLHNVFFSPRLLDPSTWVRV